MRRLLGQLPALLLAALPLAGPAADTPAPALAKQVLLLDRQGREFPIGTLRLQPDGDALHYQLHLDHTPFRDHFLSMKEMKCLEGEELWCYVPYPYANPHRIRRDDLRWLEHDLLFLYKRPGEFGADFWNGIYYQLAWQGDDLVGSARALDLDLLASPPNDPDTPPVGEFDIDAEEQSVRWLPRLRIR